MTTPPVTSPSRSVTKVRQLTATDLNLSTGIVDGSPTGNGESQNSNNTGTLPILDSDDPVLRQVEKLLADGYGGVILRGPPGTSKSWYAEAIADHLSGRDATHVRVVQFHSSYQYEDFVEGFVPGGDGKFTLTDKHLVVSCENAARLEPAPFVLVIDEISRADPARVFGEALTYIESSKRGKEFYLASGKRLSIPKNLIILGTMNEFDRGVVQVDEALERRLAFITLDPDAAILREILRENDVSKALEDSVVRFFEETLQKHPNKHCRIGHAYFRSVTDAASLRRLWEHQLRFLFERAFALGEGSELGELESRWERLAASVDVSDDATTGGQVETTDTTPRDSAASNVSPTESTVPDTRPTA